MQFIPRPNSTLEEKILTYICSFICDQENACALMFIWGVWGVHGRGSTSGWESSRTPTGVAHPPLVPTVHSALTCGSKKL